MAGSLHTHGTRGSGAMSRRYTHPLFASNVPRPQVAVGPPSIREYITSAVGMPMQHVVPMNAPARDL
eukprot:3520310-Lingulodinium_polyedra.AAC.1